MACLVSRCWRLNLVSKIVDRTKRLDFTGLSLPFEHGWLGFNRRGRSQRDDTVLESRRKTAVLNGEILSDLRTYNAIKILEYR